MFRSLMFGSLETRFDNNSPRRWFDGADKLGRAPCRAVLGPWSSSVTCLRRHHDVTSGTERVTRKTCVTSGCLVCLPPSVPSGSMRSP